MVTISIVYHSGYGHSKVIADAMYKTLCIEENVTAYLFSVEDVQWDILQASDTLIFGSPTYMGSVSAPFKAFMDESGKVWLRQEWKNKLAAGFTNAGSLSGDKLAVLMQLAIFAAQHGMNWINLGILPSNYQNTSDDVPIRLNRMGGYLGAMAQSFNESAETTPPIDDIRTAELFANRIADATRRWMRGNID